MGGGELRQTFYCLGYLPHAEHMSLKMTLMDLTHSFTAVDLGLIHQKKDRLLDVVLSHHARRASLAEDRSGGDLAEEARFHHATQEGEKFLTYELSIPGIFHLVHLTHVG